MKRRHPPNDLILSLLVATLADGGFESRGGERTAGWQSGGGAVVGQSPDAAAVEGTHYARTWHNQTLSTTFNVVGGRPVTIRLHARAVRVDGLRDMKPIAGRTTPGHLAARRFLRGANLGNGLEAPPGQDWGGHCAPDDLRLMRTEGFDHVRIPVGWHHYTGPGPEFLIRPEIFGRTDILVNAGLREGLGVIINIHHFDDFTSNPREQTPRFLAIWRQIARHYEQSPITDRCVNPPKEPRSAGPSGTGKPDSTTGTSRPASPSPACMTRCSGSRYRVQ